MSETPADVRAPEGGPPDDEGEGSTFLGDMSRLFAIPALVVLLSVGVFILFGLIASEGRSAREYLEEVRHGARNRRWQAAFELSRILTRDGEERSDPRLASEIAGTLRDPDLDEPLVRRYLILALQEIGDPSTAPAVEGALRDPDPEVRLYAARALGHLGERGSAAALIGLLQDDDAALRKVALHSLGRLGDPAAVPAILPRLEDPVVDVRWNAALALAMLGDGSGADLLLRMMDVEYLDSVEGIQEAQKVEARISAVQAAYRLRQPDLRGAVDALSRSDPSLQVRDIALRALREWDREPR